MAKKFDPQGFGNRENNVNVNVTHGVMAIPDQSPNKRMEDNGVPIEDILTCADCSESIPDNETKCPKCGGNPIIEAEVIEG